MPKRKSSKSKTTSFAWITKKYFPEADPQDINSGECIMWALVAHELVEGCELHEYMSIFEEGHAFIKYKGKYYDSESPTGVTRYKDLNYIKTLDSDVRREGKFKHAKKSKDDIMDSWEVPQEALDCILATPNKYESYHLFNFKAMI